MILQMEIAFGRLGALRDKDVSVTADALDLEVKAPRRTRYTIYFSCSQNSNGHEVSTPSNIQKSISSSLRFLSSSIAVKNLTLMPESTQILGLEGVRTELYNSDESRRPTILVQLSDERVPGSSYLERALKGSEAFTNMTEPQGRFESRRCTQQVRPGLHATLSTAHTAYCKNVLNSP